MANRTLPQDDKAVEMTNPFPTPLDEEENISQDDEISKLFYSSKVDTRALADAQAELHLERGDYLWEAASLKISYGSNPLDKDPADFFARNGMPEKGRCTIHVSGAVKPRDPKGRGGRFMFTVSPDKRYRRDQEGNLLDPLELDMFSKPWLMLTEFFFQKNERQIRSEGEIIDLLRSCLYYMYITKGKNGGNFLNQFKELSSK